MRAGRFWISLGLVVLLGSYALASGSNDSPSGASRLELDDVEQGDVTYPSDVVDWWRVSIPESGVVAAFLDGEQGRDIDLYFYDSDGDLLARSTSDDEDEVVHGVVAGGTYSIKVEAYYEYSAETDYDLGLLMADSSSGYLSGAEDIDLHRLYMSTRRVYWIFLYDREGFFDPDLFLVRGDDVVEASRSQGKLDVIKHYPDSSGYYRVAVGSCQGSGDYYLLIGSRSR